MSSLALMPVPSEYAEICANLHYQAFEGNVEPAWNTQAFKTLMMQKGYVVYLALIQGELLPQDEKALREGERVDGVDQPIGFIMVRTVLDEAEIITNCIIPSQRRKGYGKQLLMKTADQLKKNKVQKLFLDVRVNNEAAYALYEACGFQPIGKRKDYYHDTDGLKYDALVMAKDLL